MLPLISVIVPIYNVEKYLPHCIDSILTQTYQNLEIILVDDGSPDRCGQICDSYAQKDTRIRVIHKANGGLSDARNAGIDICRGEYISFIDSDDFVSPSALPRRGRKRQITGAAHKSRVGALCTYLGMRVSHELGRLYKMIATKQMTRKIYRGVTLPDLCAVYFVDIPHSHMPHAPALAGGAA